MSMNDVSKLMLSDDELQLVTNSSWILTKRRVVDKVDRLLSYLAEKQRLIMEVEKDWLPAEVLKSEPKISRGENYLQLPYLMLDYPRCFDAENIFAVRTMFWWGNFFSVTLHLSGKYKERFQQVIINNSKNSEQDLFICINENQWQHHFEADNYTGVRQMTEEAFNGAIQQRPFIKLAIKFPLQPWADLPVLLENCFAEILKLLKH
ncbi:MAG: hypothetical protein JNM14_10405 [Ferruginibacter sp.]|nr:hypothetical protein [Ferruginibacter sp.]